MKWIVFCAALLGLQVKDLTAQSIDEIMMNSATSSQALDFMSEDGGIIKTEIDMLYTFDDWLELQRLNRTGTVSRKKRKAIRGTHRRWTSNVIPYEIARRTFSSGDLQQINSALDEWMTHTCLVFRQATRSDANKIRFQNGGGCSSFVGMQGRTMPTQPVSLANGCRIKRIIVHEVGHAVGFHHEQTRPDRDRYVTIARQNIPPHLYFNFDKYSTNVINDHDVPYDYRSVMHYGNKAFSINGQYTVIPKDKTFLNTIGKSPGLSFKDIKLANKMYNCAEDCGQKQCPDGGFVGKDCECYCPGNPTKKCVGTGGGGGGSVGCTDKNQNCATWASSGECQKNPVYMWPHCKKSCGKCTEDCGQKQCPDGGFVGKDCECYCPGNPTKKCDGTGGGGGGSGDGRGGGGEGGVSGSCTDKNQNCASWASSGECQKNPAYMWPYCKKSCGKCTGTSDGCMDMSQYCDAWKRKGYCQSRAYIEYMTMNCKKACGICQTGGARSPDLCVNKNSHCSYWARIGQCWMNSVYMVLNCAKACGACE